MPYFQPQLSLPSALTFKNKTILVTGASAGLGLAATKSHLYYGASEIIAAVRSPSKAEAAKAIILSDSIVKKKQSNSTDYNFTIEVKKRYNDKLDMVLLNAGTGSLKFEKVTTGHEKTVQVNLLSPALLAVELLPVLEKTALSKGVPSRLTWVGSFVQFDHTLNKTPIKEDEKVLKFFDKEENFNSMGRYSDSKLLGTMFVEHLATFVDREKVLLNEVSPGMIKTGFGEYPFWLRRIMAIFFGLKARSPEQGAKTYVHALGVVGSETHGVYLSDNQVTKRATITSTSLGKDIKETLWNDIWQDFSKIDKSLHKPESQV